MSHILFFDDQKQWYAANWAAEHLVHLILRFVPQKDSGQLVECLDHINDFPGCDVDLTSLSSGDLDTLLKAAESALTALREAGPRSEYFRDPALFPGFVVKFEEFIQILKKRISSKLGASGDAS